MTSIDTADGEARGVTWRDTNTGEETSEEAKVVVMAGGCTENPRLWLNSGLPNPNDWVGRGYTDHHFDWFIGVLPRYTGSSKGPGSGARCDFPGRGGLENVGLPPALQAFSATFSDAGIAGHYDNDVGLSKAGAKTLGRLVGPDLRRALRNIDRLLNVLVITDDDVEAQNRVTLSTILPADENGPVPRVEFHQRARSRRTRRNREYLAKKAARLLKAAGAREIHRIAWPPLILHVQSTMRMGHDEANSVLDTGVRGARGQAPVRRRQLGAAERDRRPQPDADDAGARHAHGREDLQALLRRRSVGEDGVARLLDRPRRSRRPCAR